MSYLKFDFEFDPGQLDPEILMAFLAEGGFESFADLNKGLTGYIRKGDFSGMVLRNLLNEELSAYALRYKMAEIPDQNWNELWEKNFQPVVIANRCLVRAPFHPPQPEIPLEIVIEPKMSFGTAHHETTALMMELLLDSDMMGKKVLDMGCGTGILALLSARLGAAEITAIDNDEWAYNNSLENVQRNGASNIRVLRGDAKLIKGHHYDRVLANINRNTLLDDMPLYAKTINKDGLLYLSGFFQSDLETIQPAVEKLKLSLLRYLEKNNWVAAAFQRK